MWNWLLNVYCFIAAVCGGVWEATHNVVRNCFRSATR